jgi:hypothetical protein
MTSCQGAKVPLAWMVCGQGKVGRRDDFDGEDTGRFRLSPILSSGGVVTRLCWLACACRQDQQRCRGRRGSPSEGWSSGCVLAHGLFFEGSGPLWVELVVAWSCGAVAGASGVQPPPTALYRAIHWLIWPC